MVPRAAIGIHGPIRGRGVDRSRERFARHTQVGTLAAGHMLREGRKATSEQAFVPRWCRADREQPRSGCARAGHGLRDGDRPERDECLALHDFVSLREWTGSCTTGHVPRQRIGSRALRASLALAAMAWLTACGAAPPPSTLAPRGCGSIAYATRPLVFPTDASPRDAPRDPAGAFMAEVRARVQAQRCASVPPVPAEARHASMTDPGAR